MIRFPIQQFLDENKCYEFLVEILHQEGLRCPSCKTEVNNCHLHRRDRAPVLYYRCSCGRIFNAFTETDWQGTHHSCSKILCILKGIVQGIPTLHLARELEIDRKHLLERRHRIQAHLMTNSFHGIFSDKVAEVDEMYQNAGEKGVLHSNPDDPPRRRGNKSKGHGTCETDRPPIQGIVGRKTGRVKFDVLCNSSRTELEHLIFKTTCSGATINTDEWKSYNRLHESGRVHVSVCHTPGKRVWAKDEDGDGIREVHNNTMEGIWTGLRNFLRPFRGVNKVYLVQYATVHEWAYNLKSVTLELFRIICGVTQLAP